MMLWATTTKQFVTNDVTNDIRCQDKQQCVNHEVEDCDNNAVCNKRFNQ